MTEPSYEKCRPMDPVDAYFPLPLPGAGAASHWTTARAAGLHAAAEVF
jgi:hypothetical protein